MIYLNHLIRKDILANARGIVFDCDGVLIDSLDANTFYYNSIRAAFDLPEMSLEMRDYTHAHNIWESLRCIVPEDKFEAAWQMKLDYDYRQVLAHIKLEPGLRELLGWLRSAGQKMSINTSRTDTMDMVLDHYELGGFFHPVITSYKVARPKPHPEGVRMILAAWRMTPDEVIYIGDSSVDEQTAKAAGIRFWSFKNPYLDAEIMVPDFWTLLGCLRRAYGPHW